MLDKGRIDPRQEGGNMFWARLSKVSKCDLHEGSVVLKPCLLIFSDLIFDSRVDPECRALLV